MCSVGVRIDQGALHDQLRKDDCSETVRSISRSLKGERVFPSFSVSELTGRISFKKPNLGSLAKDPARGERSLVIAEQGHVLFTADMAQIEARVVAGLCQDPEYMDQFAPGRDVHAEMAERLLGGASHRETAKKLYGMDSRTYGEPTELRWRTGGQIRHGMPVAMEHWAALEAALVRIHLDSLLDPPPDWLVPLSCSEYLNLLELPPEVADALHGWLIMMTGANPDLLSVLDPLGVIAEHHGVVGLLTSLRASPIPGWQELAGRMAAGSAAQVRLASAVVGVQRTSQPFWLPARLLVSSMEYGLV
ncbi:MAG: DNA polymerase [Actinomycetota bacterium]|nr:DNA polymerase [Actinomycetota bacterium]